MGKRNPLSARTVMYRRMKKLRAEIASAERDIKSYEKYIVIENPAFVRAIANYKQYLKRLKAELRELNSRYEKMVKKINRHKF